MRLGAVRGLGVNDIFYFDFISPYAYVGWHGALALSKKHGRPLTAVPVLFAGLLNHHGTKGPAEVPAKRDYVFKDAVRKAAQFGVSPIVPPPSHPFSPLLALRVASIIDDVVEKARAITALYGAVWGGQGGAEDPSNVERVLSAAELDGPALVRAAASDEVKTRLREQTAGAIAHGVFGVPTLLVDGEIFWGVDGLVHAEQRMLGHDPVNEVDLSQWTNLPSTATRIR
jgi:2-hydroxychromene-2-carboxylate isomerase